MKVTYVKTQLKSLINVSKIVTVHYYEFDKNFVFDGEKHDFWEMVYVDKGQVEISCDEKQITLSQGEIVFHRPNEFHSIRAYNSAPNFFVVSFVCHSSAMAHFQRFHTRLDKPLKPFISSIITEAENVFEIPKNAPFLKQLQKKENAAVGGEQLIKTYLEQLLILLLRNVTQAPERSVFPNKESMESHVVAKVKQFIHDRLYERFYVSDLCSHVGYCKTYLSNLFHEQTGETMTGYAVKAKIAKAKQLIQEGNKNFSQISDLLAFDNPQYFSRVFKRVTGTTPTEFKQSLWFNG